MTTVTATTAPPPGRPSPAHGQQPRPSSRPRSRPAALVAWVVVVLLGQAAVLADVDVPVLRPVLAAALMIGLPLLLLTRSWGDRLADRLLGFLYAVGAVTLSLIALPLAVNTVSPWVGVDQPLARPVLVAVWTVVDLALVVRYRPGAPVSRATACRWTSTVARLRFEPAVTLAAVAVVLAVAGAVRLNNGAGGTVAALGHAAAILAPAYLTLRRGSLRRDATVLYLSSAALLLSTSLRGWSITGHDIQNEYLAFLYTNDSHHWVMSSYPTPYNACLSINILPSVLSQYLGISGLLVFKVLLQLLFAVVPVCVYVITRRVVPGRVAALAVLLFIAFPTFYTDMPFLVRQEVAYVFVALVLLAATQTGWTDRRTRTTAYLFGVGVILSHYATTYLLVITLLAGTIGYYAGRLWRRRRHARAMGRGRHVRPPRGSRRHGAAILLHPLLVVAVGATAWGWSSPATNSGGHLAETVSSLATALLKGDAVAGSSDLKYSVVFGSGPTEAERFRDYTREIIDQRRAQNASGYVFAAPSGAVENPPVAEREPLPLTAAGRAVSGAGIDVAGVNSLLKLGSAALIQLALGLGLLALVFFSRITRRFSREMFWLVLGSIAALVSVAVVPGLSASYGVLRAFQQTLIFAAPVVAIGLFALVTPLRRLHRRAVPVGATTVATLVGLTLTGAVPAVFGGYDAVLSQSDSGAYYEQLYTADPQLSTAQWLATQTRGKGLRVASASDIVNITRLQMYLPRSVTVDDQFLPLQLRKGSYVVLGPQTIDEGTAGVFYTGDVLTYRYPVKAVEQQLDVIYSTPGNRILR